MADRASQAARRIRRHPPPARGQGALTILFTDVEGSTELTQRLRDQTAREVLREHERITRRALQDHSGTEIKTTGDSFMASFASASDALRCAIALQRFFHERNRMTQPAIHVRVGINAGEPISEDGDLFGTAAVAAARITQLGNGGEILVSNVVRELVAGKGFSMIDRGETTLRGLEYPARIFQLRWQEDPDELELSGRSGVRSLSSLPQPPTGFLGREDDIRQLLELLTRPACRLVTVAGSGGSGKTRLAIEVARQMSRDFHDGVWFVGLDGITSSEFLAAAIADALQFSLRGQEEPWTQLLDYLAGKQLLLVLDNFEHLITAAELVSDLLGRAPGVKTLVTSREALNLREEWLYPIGGMRFPVDSELADLANYDAVQLFVDRARQMRPGFSLEDCNDVVRICELVDGLPLGIELAASWLKLLSCSEIVSEVERHIDFLETGLRNVPARHRSMRAVFDGSWKLLTQQEQDVFRRLSVFHGSFSREAAARISRAPLEALSSLVDKSLLNPLPAGRYRLHELLRQYAAEKLAEHPQEAALTHDRCCAYYAEFLEARLADALRGHQVRMAAEIEAELENIRASGEWAVDQGNFEALARAIPALVLFWQYRSRYTEAAASLERVARRIGSSPDDDETRVTLALTLVHLGWFYIRLGRLEEAKEVLRRCHGMYGSPGRPPVDGWATDPELALGVIATIEGEYSVTARLGEQARRTAEEHSNPWNLALANYVLARAALLQGQNDAARQYAGTAYEKARDANDYWFTAYCLIELGNVECALGNYQAAAGRYRASYEIRREFEDPEGMAIALAYLGEAAAGQGSHEEAQELYSQSISLYEDINDKGGLATVYLSAGRAAVSVGDYEAARDRFRRSVQLAVEVRFVPLVLSIVAAVADLLLRTDKTEDGLTLAALALGHPGSDHDTRSRARQLIDAGTGASPQTGRGDGKTDLERCITLLDEILAVTTAVDLGTLLESAARAGGAAAPHAARRAYPDELTEREVEVLRLVARGRSNREIAGELFITTNTAANHVKNILSKTGSANRTEAAAYAIDKRLA